MLKNMSLFDSEDMNKWTLWGYYLSPFTYGLNAMAVNEFLGESWSQVRKDLFCEIFFVSENVS